MKELKKCWCYGLSNNNGDVLLVCLGGHLQVGVDLSDVGYRGLLGRGRIQNIRAARKRARVTI